MADSTVRYAISVITRDRVAVIADITGVLFELGANLDALSQTVVWGWFTMIICGTFPAGVSPERIKKAVEASEDCTATVLPFEPSQARKAVQGEPFVVTAVGEDKPGIVHALTGCFAQRGINIEDVWNEVRDSRFIIIFHVTMPAEQDAKDVRYELEALAQQLGVSIMLQHQDIFTATNSLSIHSKKA